MVTTQVGRGHLPTEPAWGDFAGIDHKVGAQVCDQIAELVQPVLQWGAGEQDGAVALVEQAARVAGALGVRVLDVVRLINDHTAQVRQADGVLMQPVEAVEGGHRDASVAPPVLQGCDPLGSVQAVRGQRRLGTDLAHPVGDDRGRADHQEAVRPDRSQMSQDRNRFHRLPEPHLVADDHLALHEGEPRSEALIAAQRSRQELRLEFQRANGLDDVLGKVAVRLLLILGDEPQFTQQREVIGRTRDEVIPGVSGSTTCTYI